MNFTRELRFAPAAAAVEAGADMVLDMAFASELPYERWWGVEVLDCTAGAVDLARLNDGAPLLYNHDWNALRGSHVPGTVRCDADRVVRGQVRVSHAADDGRTIRMIQDGHLTKASIGYEIHEVVEQFANKSRTLDGRLFGRVLSRCQRDSGGDVAAFRRALDAAAGPFERAANEPATYRVTKWAALENSLVTVPADPSVGVGRMHTREELPADPPAAIPESEQEQSTMTEAVIEVDVAAIERAALDKAQKRVADIAAMGDQFKDFDGAKALADAAIRNNTPADVFAKELMAHVSKRGQQWQPEIGMNQKEVKSFSVVRAINAMLTGDWSKAGLEREASAAMLEKAQRAGVQRQGTERSFMLPAEIQRRDMTVGTAANGGNMVATNLRPQDFIELLRARTLVAQLGARSLTGLVGNADITKHTGAGTAYWLANEATAITESNQTVGLLQLRPKQLGAYTEVSRQLLQQSTPDADAFVMDDLAKVLAVAIDAAAINGSGASGQPTGILGTSGIGSVTGTSLAYAGILEFQTDVAGAEALHSGCAYLTTPAVAALLSQRARFSNTDTPLWKGNILDGEVGGFRGATSTNVPAATMLFGDFSQVILADWSVIELDVNPYANFPAGIIGVRAFKTCDVGVRIPGAFSAASSIT